jgi:hypothetical protein
MAIHTIQEIINKLRAPETRTAATNLLTTGIFDKDWIVNCSNEDAFLDTVFSLAKSPDEEEELIGIILLSRLYFDGAVEKVMARKKEFSFIVGKATNSKNRITRSKAVEMNKSYVTSKREAHHKEASPRRDVPSRTPMSPDYI